MGDRRNTELLLLLAGAVPVFLLYAMYVMQQGNELTWQALIVPIGLLVGFAVAHVAVRIFAPGADPAILPLVFVMSGIGITFVTRLDPDSSTRQVIWLFIGIAVMIATLVVVRNLERLARYKYVFGILGLALLLLPIFVGFESGGSKLWVRVAGVSFQPGEIAKVLIVIFLASYLAENRELLAVAQYRVPVIGLRIPRLRMLLPLLVMWAISLVIVVYERDLGSAVLFFGIFVIMLYVATGRLFYPIVAVVLLAVGGVLAYHFFSHVRVRISVWLDPFADPSGQGYQILQALYSMADGGLFGDGIGQGMPTLIPVAASDFIFPAMAEEIGLLGGSAIILLYMSFTVRGLLTAARAKSDLAAFMAVGLTSAISLQAFLIIGGTTKLIPLTGVTLPFMSQGGSSLLASFIIVGLMLRCGHEGTGHQVEMTGDGVSSPAGELPHAAGKSRLASLHLATPESGVLGRRALSKRLTVLTTCFAVLFAALIANLAYVQVVEAKDLQDNPNNNHTIAREAYVDRGSIVTSDGVVLAESVRQPDGTYVRSYPQGSLASHTVGYVSTQYGTSGIESTYDSVLSGASDYSSWDSALNSLAGNTTTGQDVVLSIDSRIQAAAESALEGRTGAIVVLNVQTGAVLAKASSPTYSNDELAELFASNDSSALYDRASQALYEPGSTFKVITLSAALQSGTATLSSVYSSPSSLEIGGGIVSNFDNEDYGDITLEQAFDYSSNTVFGQVAVQVGATTLANTATAFGYGTSVGTGFTVTPSLVPDPVKANDWQLAWAGCGQPTNLGAPMTTVTQAAMVAATIANGGVVMNPYIVSAVTDSTGATVSTTQPQTLGRAVSADVAQQVGEAMHSVVTSGTGAAAASGGIDVAGKTGTAETGSSANPNAWFIGYAPYDNPQVAIAVVIENDAEHAATAIAGDVLQAALAA
ncbi:MAG: FtsW/RodA/SpoVE family cell cycle protein [Coriobacteriales bacterium]|jgi:cell division protein FtsI/penicillin-binding protein 2/cell division protein FtsW (lipid II flippase)